MRKRWITAALIAGLCFVPFVDASQKPPAPAPEVGMTGKWASESAITLKKWRDKVETLLGPDTGLFNVDGGIPNNGPGSPGLGGGLNPGPARGTAGPRRGRDFAQRGVQGPRAGNDPAAVPLPELPELPEGPPVTFDIKVDKTGKMTGSVVLSLDEQKDEKYKIEEGKVEGKTFRFLTLHKYSGLTLPTEWKGEMLSDNFIKAVRLLPSGASADEPFALRRLLK
jgi:hypothetical protein